MATFWWRDDDAEESTPQLDKMLAVAAAHPICLAVVPGNKNLKPLADRLGPLDNITVLQHGWKHTNNTHTLHGEHMCSDAYAGTWQTPHAMGGWSEYPDYRAYDEVIQEVSSGCAALRAAFGTQVLPVFVPPCHMLSDRFLPILPAHGVSWISRLGPRRLWGLGLGILDVNAHVDLMDWRVRGFGDPHRKIRVVLNHLRARRQGLIDSREPTGIYTHHLYQDGASWEFIAQLLAITGARNAKWLSGREVFSLDGIFGAKDNVPQAATLRLTTPVSWDRPEIHSEPSNA